MKETPQTQPAEQPLMAYQPPDYPAIVYCIPLVNAVPLWRQGTLIAKVSAIFGVVGVVILLWLWLPPAIRYINPPETITAAELRQHQIELKQLELERLRIEAHRAVAINSDTAWAHAWGKWGDSLKGFFLLVLFAVIAGIIAACEKEKGT